MPRHAKGPRLHRHVNEIWCIRDDGGKFLSTGTRNRREAERSLARYIAEKDRPSGPASPDQMTVATALDTYGREHAPTCKDPERIGYAIAALTPILGSLPISSIAGEVCRRYARTRDKAPGTIRKELSTLQAALNYCHAEGYLTIAPKVRLPAKPAPRDRWLTRDEAARLLRAAYRNPRSKHLSRFILVAIYTGTRSEAILRMRFMPNTEGGWVDTEAGMMYHRGVGVAETKKRQPPIPIPRPATRTPAPMGTQRRPLCRRGRRSASRQRQDRVENRACGVRHRPLHAARSAPHGDYVGDAERNRQVGGGRILRSRPESARARLWTPPSRLPEKRSRGDGAEANLII